MELRTNKQNKETKTESIKSVKKEDNIHKDHRTRLKNQYLSNGLDSLTDVQKLEMLLFYAIPQKDTNPLAHELLKEFGSLDAVLCAKTSELTSVNGIKENTATLLKFVGEMLNYCSRPTGSDYLNSSKKCKEFATAYFSHLTVEKFYMFCLTKSNTVKKTVLINTGTEGEVSVQIRKLTQIAIEQNCNRIVVAHNHPNGKAIMSNEDCSFTYSLICSCLLNNIELLDHIIVGTDRTISIYEQGILAKLYDKANDALHISPEKRLFISDVEKIYEKSMIDE